MRLIDADELREGIIEMMSEASFLVFPTLQTILNIVNESQTIGAGIVVESIGKQLMKKPNENDRTICPTCNSKWNYGHPHTEYCCHCGQRIDTEET